MPETRTQKRKADDDAPAGKNALLSSVPGLSIADVRLALSEQRRLYHEKGFVNWQEQVLPHHSMTRLEFNFQYVNGVARKRLDKHKRASNKDNH
jgi:hypothetical protein